MLDTAGFTAGETLELGALWAEWQDASHKAENALHHGCYNLPVEAIRYAIVEGQRAALAVMRIRAIYERRP